MKNSNLLNRLLSYSHEKQKMGGMRRYAVMLMMLLTLGVGQAWAYNCNYANVYYDNSVTKWTYVQLLYEKSDGSTGWNMSHVAHTDLYWKAPGDWGDNNFSGVRFSDGTNSDWGWAYNSNSWNRTGNAGKECSGFFGGDIANHVHLFTCNIKTTDDAKVNIGHPYYGSDPTILNKTVNVGSKTKVGNNDYDDGVASVAAISMKHYSFNSSTYASVQDYYSSNVPTHSKGSTSTYAIYPTYTSNVTYSFSNLTSGYEFVGWYDGEGNFLSKNEEYTVYTTSNYDIYAYFAQTHTVTISAGTGGEVSVSGDQTIGQNGLEVTATPNTGYMFDGWDYTEGVSLTSSDATMTITATASGTVTAKFVPIWTIKGSDAEMGNWNEVGDNDLIYVSGTTYSTTIDLVKNKTYQFKVFNRSASGYAQWYGYGSSDAEVTFTRGGTKSRSDLANNKSNLGITTDENLSGTYTFTWNTSGNVISVTYPTPSYTISYRDQGNADFSGTQTSAPTTHTYGTPTTLKIPTKVGYNFAGWWTDAACTSSQVGTNSAATLAADGYTANIILYAKWTAKTYTVALDQEDGTGGLDEIEDVTYGAAMPTIDEEDLPSKSNYTFDGYYDGETDGNGSGTKYYNANGTSARAWDIDAVSPTLYAKWTENTYTVTFANDGHGSTTPTGSQSVGVVTGVAISATPNDGYEFDEWTSSDGGTFTSAATSASNTFKPTANTTVTAKFKIMTYNGTIDKSTDAVGATDGSYSVTYGATTLTATDPEKAGYHVSGYFLDEDCKRQIANADGTLLTEMSIGLIQYTNAEGEWIYDGEPKLYVTWEGNTITIKLWRNDGTETYSTTSVQFGKSGYTPAVATLVRAGYDFLGYFTAESGGTRVFKPNGDTDSDASTYIGTYSTWVYPNNVELYAHWDEVELTFDNNSGEGDGDWNTASNWDPACVPTKDHDVAISAEATVGSSAVAKSVTIDEDGSLTISSTGALEVAGSIDNDDPSKLVVRSRGALIYDGSTNASVEMSMSTGWHLVALPVAGVSVSSAFAGKGVYTYVWDNSEKAWERRGYYDDLMGNEAILVTGSTGHTFSGALVSTGDGGGSLTYTGADGNKDVNMFANNLTAPIKVSGMTISGSPDGVPHLFYGSGWIGLNSDDVIPAMQGYAILASSGGGSFSYSYATAVRGATSPNAPLYAPRRTTSDILDHITIYVSGNEWKQRIRLYENEQFTDEIDMGYEALHMEGEGFAGELYAQAAEKMNILAVPDLEGTVIGFIPGEATNYTISFEGDGKGYYLNDVLTNQSTLITEDNTYDFTPDENTNATRFIVSKTPLISSTTTGVNQVSDGVKARKQLINGILYIIRDGKIYNAEGALVK